MIIKVCPGCLCQWGKPLDMRVDRHFPDHLQLNRRANLRTLLAELHRDGYVSLLGQAAVLGVNRAALQAMLAGDPIEDHVARELEWAMHRREGWLDKDHRADPG